MLMKVLQVWHVREIARKEGCRSVTTVVFRKLCSIEIGKDRTAVAITDIRAVFATSKVFLFSQALLYLKICAHVFPLSQRFSTFQNRQVCKAVTYKRETYVNSKSSKQRGMRMEMIPLRAAWRSLSKKEGPYDSSVYTVRNVWKSARLWDTNVWKAMA